MGSLYYIKKTDTTYTDPAGHMLMDAIYDCCIDGNPDNRKIFTSGSSQYINPDIRFARYNIPEFDTKMRKMIMAMDCGDLANQYIWSYFLSDEYCSLIEFEDDSKIKTVLSFSFNTENNCIEINSFCCSTRGGGNILNFLLNAVKCGINICSMKGKEYVPKIILTSSHAAIEFYEKFGFTKETELETKFQIELHDTVERLPSNTNKEEQTSQEKKTPEPKKRNRSISIEEPQISESRQEGDKIKRRKGGTIKKHTTKYKKRKSRQTKNKFTRKS